MKRGTLIVSLLALSGAALAQSGTTPHTVASQTPASKMTAPLVKAAAAKSATAAAAEPAPPPGPMTLMLRGLDKITGRPTEIVAPIGVPVKFATLTITARYCYSTPPSETPETAAFVQIQDHRPDQNERRVFSGWMYASTPGLNGMEHPLYDVWVIGCRGGEALPASIAANAPQKVKSPDSSDKEQAPQLPEGAGQ